jgi:hypothetical protein
VRALRSLCLIVDLKTVAVGAMAVASTYLCGRFGLIAEFPLTLIATAVVFPIVFSIGGAYKRREAALDEYGSIKTHGRAIYFAARDWIEESDPLLLKQASSVCSSPAGTSSTLPSPRCRSGRPGSTPPSRSSRS